MIFLRYAWARVKRRSGPEHVRCPNIYSVRENEPKFSSSLSQSRQVGLTSFWLNAARFVCSTYPPTSIFSFRRILLISLGEVVSNSNNGWSLPCVNPSTLRYFRLEHVQATASIFCFQKSRIFWYTCFFPCFLLNWGFKLLFNVRFVLPREFLYFSEPASTFSGFDRYLSTSNLFFDCMFK